MTKKILQDPFISVIVPLYNEESRLANLSKIFNFFKKKNFNYELILINDGSRDKTLDQLNELSKNFKFKLISYPENRGKGYAVKMGMMKARGKYRLFTDIDLSTPIEEFDKFIPYLKKFDVVIGSRKMKGSKVIIHQPSLREKLGKGFTKLSQIVLQLNIRDFTCGFKCFSKVAALEIFSKQQVGRWGFDSEILFLAKKFGYKIKEIPVKWSNDPTSRVKFPQDIIQSLFDLYTIRLNEIKKK